MSNIVGQIDVGTRVIARIGRVYIVSKREIKNNESVIVGQTELYENGLPMDGIIIARKSWGCYGVEWIVRTDDGMERYFRSSELKVSE